MLPDQLSNSCQWHIHNITYKFACSTVSIETNLSSQNRDIYCEVYTKRQTSDSS